MRATRSKDGQYRFTFRISHRVAAEDLMVLVATQYLGEEKVTRKMVLDGMRKQLEYSGPWTCGSMDYIDRKEENLAWDIVYKLFPELKEHPNDGLVTGRVKND